MKPALRSGKRLFLHLVAAVAFSTPALGLAQSCNPDPMPGQPLIGLALGGGGARGYAHIGVLKYLEEHRIPYHRIAGTSMGSIAGGLAATGMDSAAISQVVQGIDWVDVFSDQTERQDLPARRKQDDLIGLYGPKLGVGKNSTLLPSGVVGGRKIQFLFETLVSERVQVNSFDELPIPYRAVATDIVTGDMVVLADGSLATAMRSSMSVPGAFDPVRKGDRLLVDGGLVRNLPVDVVNDLGADVVIAVDVGTPLRKADDIVSVLAVVDQMSSLAIVANTRRQIEALNEDDILIRPKLGDDITSASFDRFSDAFGLGYAAALAVGNELSSLAVSEAEYTRWRETLESCNNGSPVIQFVRLNNQSRFSDEVLQNLIHVQEGQPLDVAQLNHDLRQIHGLGFIRQANYQIVEDQGVTGVEIIVEQDGRGTDFIETGLTLTGGGRGTFINLQTGYLKTDLDQRGSEFRAVLQVGNELGVYSDIYKYLDDGQLWTLNPFIAGSRRDVLIYEQGQAIASARINQMGAGLNFSREFGRHATLGVGVSRSFGDGKVDIGPPTDEESFDAGEWYVTAVWDRLDNLYLPTRGTRAQLEYVSSESALGADAEYEQVLASVLSSKTWGLHNVQLSARYDVTLDDRELPLYALFTGGGFLNMSGFEPNELVGNNFGVVGLGYRYQVLEGGYLPGYVGGTVEYGNVADRREDLFDDGLLNGSIYFSYNTPLGPLYLGYGWNEERRGLIFLRLGAILGTDNIGNR